LTILTPQAHTPADVARPTRRLLFLIILFAAVILALSATG